VETEKNNDEHDEPECYPRLKRFLDRFEKFYEDFVEPNGLEEMFCVFAVLAIILIVAIVIIFFLPIVIKLISLWWNLIL